MARADTGRLRSQMNPRWTPTEDFLLENLIGTASYAQIALRLGRSASAVQRRASYKGWSQRQQWRGEKAQREAVHTERLRASEDELAAYL